MNIHRLRVLQVWLVLLFWFSIVFLTQIFIVFLNDLFDLIVGFSSHDFWTLFFQAYWGLSAILVASACLYISHRQLQGKHWRIPKVDLTRQNEVALILLSIVLRLVLAPLFSHGGDMTTFLLAGYNIAHGNDPYDMALSAYEGPEIPVMIQGRDRFALGYPLLWGLIASFSYRLSNLIDPNSLALYIFTLKSWLIMSEILLAYLLFYTIKQSGDREKGVRAALFFLLCPFVILVGSVWGQNDVLCALFLILSMNLLVRGRPFASGLTLGAGFAVKYYPIVTAPILFLSLRDRKQKGTFILGVAVAVLIVLFYPFLVWGGNRGMRYLTMLSSLSQMSGGNQTLLTPFYAVETMFQVIRKDSWIQAWFWFKDNPLVRSFWMLPMIWLYLRHESLVGAKSSDSKPTLQEILPSSISALLILMTFKLWVTEQLFLTPLTLSILYSYSAEAEDSDYLNLLWILLVLSCWFTTRLGQVLLLPVWDLVKGWAFYITYLGNRYMFWIRSLTSSLVSLYIATFNLTYIYVLQRRTDGSVNIEKKQ